MINSNWSKEKYSFNLNSNQIHLWLIDVFNVSNNEHQFDFLLNEDELMKKSKYHFERDRIVYSTSRGILRILLHSYLNVDNDKIVFTYNEFGKPYLNDNQLEGLFFNTTHSKKFAMLAFNKNDEIGVDIEHINQNMIKDDISKNYFSPYEISEYSKVEKSRQADAFFKIWTRKEAYIKARGEGLSIPLDSFDITLDPELPKLLRSTTDQSISKWMLYNLEIHDEYCGALVNCGERKQIKKFLINDAKTLIN